MRLSGPVCGAVHRGDWQLKVVHSVQTALNAHFGDNTKSGEIAKRGDRTWPGIAHFGDLPFGALMLGLQSKLCRFVCLFAKKMNYLEYH